ncbi:hypothetical protein DFR49_1754, partial [Hephaestia caeni]
MCVRRVAMVCGLAVLCAGCSGMSADRS